MKVRGFDDNPDFTESSYFLQPSKQVKWGCSVSKAGNKSLVFLLYLPSTMSKNRHMIKHRDQRIGVFVDVQNLYYSARNIYKARVNFEKIMELAVEHRQLIRAIAYVISSENSEQTPFFDVLHNLGYELRQKELQSFWGGNRKGDWDVGLSIDAIKMSEKLDVVGLVTGDGDFVPLVEFLQFKGVMVEIMAFGKATSSKLIEQADSFTDLDNHADKITMVKSSPHEGQEGMEDV
jgi:uncharacterized LabA/DUF88 family protein